MENSALLQLNLLISTTELSISQGKTLELWKQILELCEKIDGHLEIHDWLLACYKLIQSQALGKWKFKSGQNVFIQALLGQGCNCSCGCQLLLCLAEWRGKLGEIGEAKWRNHTTLAYKRPNTDQIWILETTNVKPRWRRIQDIKRCFFQVEFRPRYIFLHSLGELGHSRFSCTAARRAVSRYPAEFWRKNAGEIGEIIYLWATKSDQFRQKSTPLLILAMDIAKDELGQLLQHKLLTLCSLLAAPGSSSRVQLLKATLPTGLDLNSQCPVNKKT